MAHNRFINELFSEYEMSDEQKDQTQDPTPDPVTHDESDVESGVQDFPRAKRRLDGDRVTVKPYPSGEAKVIDSRGFERHVTASELAAEYTEPK